MQPSLTKKSVTAGSVISSAFALLFGLTAGVVQAQDAAEPLEEITVTGSRLARDPNLTGALPVQSVGEEDIQLSGEFSIADVVNDVPALLTSVTSENSIDSTFSDGANVLSLRGLGTARTLVLVDGRRHVGGVQGTSSVDIGSIPMRLVERVEVLTGGASAIYGADAVTGVINFITKDNFEGFNVDASYGISDEGDGNQTSITATWGTNFADDRGNIAVSVDWRTDEGLTFADRPNEFYGTAGDWVNPALRFQQGDIGGNTPLFEQYYDYNNTGLFSFGLSIPTAQGFVDDYNAQFGTTITTADLSTAEMALIDRAANAPQRAVHPELTFPFTSAYGYVIPGNPFTFAGFDPATAIDLDNNGNPDCLDSFHGYNSVFGAASFGVVGGCWAGNADGSYSVVQDGLVAGNFQGFGGSSYDVYRQDYLDYLLPDDKVSVNVLGHYDINDSLSVFGEVKYVTAETDTHRGANSFWDLIFGSSENPFLPAFIQPIAAQTGGVATTIDPHAFDSFRITERETVRAVIGLEGELDNGWSWEIAANYGEYTQDTTITNDLIIDRWFAALDAISDPVTGQPICRSDIDPTVTPQLNTPFQIPAYEAGFFSFTPGDGQCRPLNIWAGRTGITQDALDFLTVDTWSKLTLDQFVLSAFLTGDTSDWFELPAGPIAFAVGAEYRDEGSDFRHDDLSRGIIPAGSPLPAGSNIADTTANTSLVWRPQLTQANEVGSYDVTDVYVETAIPLLADVPGARELTLEAAFRLSDYSSIGQTTTWKTNLIWAPIDSLAVRGTFSEAVRAPNITELFGPEVGTNFRPDDPCDVAQINAIAADDPTLAANTQANCLQVLSGLGIPAAVYQDPVTGAYNFQDPLSASFGGVTSGNASLLEETAETLTAGIVFQPEFLPGLSLTVDYWDISIDDAIQAVSAQNIVDGCYQGAALNQPFCDLSSRNSDPASAQAGGFIFLRQTTLNFAKIETNGVDASIRYAFEVGAHGFDVTVSGTSVDEINFFQNPLDLTEVNPELLEINRPELAGNVFLNWSIGDLRVGWQSQYMDTQLYGGIEVETADTLYGPIVFQDDFWQHDLSASYLVNDDVLVYGGIKNVTDELPFITENAFPASPRGMFFFVGVDWTVQ